MSTGATAMVAAARRATPWAARLAELRLVADPDVDDAIKRFRLVNPELSDLRLLVRRVVDEFDQAKIDCQPIVPTLRGIDWTPPPLPAWAADDDHLIARGQAVFNQGGLEMGAALTFAALPMGYAATHGAKALSRTSDFATEHLIRRVAETGQMLIDVMGTRAPDNLDPGGRGYATAVGLRLLHGCVRSLLAEAQEPDGWPKDMAPALNQEIMLATLLDFTLVTWRAMERMGIELSPEDREAHLYTWSLIGNLMGLQACRDGPLTLQDVDELGNLFSAQLGDTAEGQRLMDALLREFEEFMPLGSRKLPRSLVHWLFEGAPGDVAKVPTMLGVQRPAWWTNGFFSVVRALNRAEVPSPLRRIIDRARHRAGRLVLIAFIDGFTTEAPPFRIPDELQRSWSVRPERNEKRAHQFRLRVRGRTRRVNEAITTKVAQRMSERRSRRVPPGR